MGHTVNPSPSNEPLVKSKEQKPSELEYSSVTLRRFLVGRNHHHTPIRPNHCLPARTPSDPSSSRPIISRPIQILRTEPSIKYQIETKPVPSHKSFHGRLNTPFSLA